jgi:hypothetical protein
VIFDTAGNLYGTAKFGEEIFVGGERPDAGGSKRISPVRKAELAELLPISGRPSGGPTAEFSLIAVNSCGAGGIASAVASESRRLRRFPIEGVDFLGAQVAKQQRRIVRSQT